MTSNQAERFILATHPELAELAAAEQQRQRAMLSGDRVALASLLAQGAVYIHSSGLVDDEKTYLDSVRANKTKYKAIDLRVSTVRLLSQDVVLLSGTTKISALQRERRLELDNVFVMTWVRGADGWRMTSWQSTAAFLP